MSQDFRFENRGSVALVTPVSDAARDWVMEHVEIPAWAWIGRSFAVEPRLIGNLIDGITEAGFNLGEEEDAAA